MRIPFAARSLSFREAVILLDGPASPIVEFVDADDFWFVAAIRSGLVDWGRYVVQSLADIITGAGRFARTEILTAAHTVLVVTALVEAVDEAGIKHLHGTVTELMLSRPPALAIEPSGVGVLRFYQRFVPDKTARDAHAHYLAARRRADNDVPEFAVWADPYTTVLGAALQAMSRGASADTRRRDLATRYRRRLDRQILDSAAVPAHVHMPALGVAYISPHCRVRRCTTGDRPAAEHWWRESDTAAGGRGEHACVPPGLLRHRSGRCQDRGQCAAGEPGDRQSAARPAGDRDEK